MLELLKFLNPNDAFLIFLQGISAVLLLLCGIWWVENHVNRAKARERKLVDDAKPYRTPKQRAEDEEEWERWLREGRG